MQHLTAIQQEYCRGFGWILKIKNLQTSCSCYRIVIGVIVGLFVTSPRHPERIISRKSRELGAGGNVARDNVNFENWGGLVDGKTQLPIFIGEFVDINNSPDTVNPKLS